MHISSRKRSEANKFIQIYDLYRFMIYTDLFIYFGNCIYSADELSGVHEVDVCLTLGR
eukprot:COSAG01_NODE_8219_length_2870_cov_2.578131_2_plen_58_part_00